jgi:hypothetical protein
MAKNGKKAGKGAAKEVLVVGTKMKDVVKAAGCQSSGDLIDAVSQRVHEMLAAAVSRAKENGRATVRPYDL